MDRVRISVVDAGFTGRTHVNAAWNPAPVPETFLASEGSGRQGRAIAADVIDAETNE